MLPNRARLMSRGRKTATRLRAKSLTETVDGLGFRRTALRIADGRSSTRASCGIIRWQRGRGQLTTTK